MTYSYIARQPILTRDKKVYGYELLFRNSEENAFPNIDPDEATSKLLLQQHLNGDISTISMGKVAFINFHTKTLLNNFPSFLPKEKVFIEVLETVNLSPNLVHACQKSHQLGYRIALDDHDFHQKWHELLPYTALIKVDIQAQPLKTLKQYLAPFKKTNIALLAERVETQAEFDACLELGFHFFQGFFFQKPMLLKNRSLAPQQLLLMQLLGAVYQPEINFDEVASIIQNDLSLSLSLLKFVNSAAFTKRGKIKDIQHAVAFIGESELRKYTALISFAKMSEKQPEELIIKSLTRAYFMAELERLSTGHNKDNLYFMVGLLSLLDVILQIPMANILQQLPLNDKINQAVLYRRGHAGRLLHIIEAYERGAWERLDRMAKAIFLNHVDIGQCFVTASELCQHVLNSTQENH